MRHREIKSFAYNKTLLSLETQISVLSAPGTAASKACFLEKNLSHRCGRWEGPREESLCEIVELHFDPGFQVRRKH